MALLWVALFTMAGCNSEITTVPQGEQADGMMPVSIQVHTADYSVQTRAGGSVKGVEGIAEGSMQLLCFDKGGYFLGMGQSVTIGANPTGDDNKHSLRATVYNSTARIHFLANANITMQHEKNLDGESNKDTKARLTSVVDLTDFQLGITMNY